MRDFDSSGTARPISPVKAGWHHRSWKRTPSSTDLATAMTLFTPLEREGPMTSRKQTTESAPEWVEVTPEFIVWDQIGTQIEGTLLGKEPMDLRGRMTVRYSFDGDGGLLECHGTTRLDDLMKMTSIGEHVCIRYQGDTEIPGVGNMKNFRVWRALAS